ncbi:cupredoxin domain-containing protein [Algibacillus agarilyticus]|uniref:cupredoxin domain-containing protein n=1 Tax=Algibacillus agarilyticus TaxID=2234133 RepID=UPI000DD078AD|nr:cupredoxin domain-containing protein [Algibacillus agarilyticus]
MNKVIRHPKQTLKSQTRLWLLLVSFLSFLVQASTIEEVELNIINHLFVPAKLHLMANKKYKLKIINQDNTPEEFDSFDLNREKMVFPNKITHIYIGPLSVGEYHFFGEYNPNTAKGKIIVNQTDSIQGDKNVN